MFELKRAFKNYIRYKQFKHDVFKHHSKFYQNMEIFSLHGFPHIYNLNYFVRINQDTMNKI